MPDTILIASDDEATGAFLADNLSADGYRARRADSPAHALALLASAEPAAVICDLNGSALAVVEQIRGEQSASDIPLLALTGHDPISCVRHLERGCDDVVAKPFRYPELRARLASLLRRSQPRRATTRLGALAIEPGARQVTVNGQAVKLTRLEYALLQRLASDPTRVHTKARLLADVFGYPAGCSTRTLDSHACRLRHKLAEHGYEAIVNVWGVGYRFQRPPAESKRRADP